MCPYYGSQEESLIRKSNLWWSINPELNKNLSSPHIPWKGCIYSPQVTFLIKNIKYHFDVVSVAAIDRRYGSDEIIYLKKYFETFITDEIDVIIEKITIMKLIAVAYAAKENKVDHLILGALGCGCFKNNPGIIARCFKQVFCSIAEKATSST